MAEPRGNITHTHERLRRFGYRAAVLLCLVCSPISHAVANQASVVIVAHPSVPTDALTTQTLMSLYTGRLRMWSMEVPSRAISWAPGTAAYDDFAVTVLGMSPNRLASLTASRVFVGSAHAPMVSADTAAILKQVASITGAVGYVPLSADTQAQILPAVSQGRLTAWLVVDGELVPMTALVGR